MNNAKKTHYEVETQSPLKVLNQGVVNNFTTVSLKVPCAENPSLMEVSCTLRSEVKAVKMLTFFIILAPKQPDSFHFYMLVRFFSRFYTDISGFLC